MEQLGKVALTAIAGAAAIPLLGIPTLARLVQRHQIVNAEKQKWKQDHTILYDKFARNQSMELLNQAFPLGAEISLCKVDRYYFGFAYSHWFLLCGDFVLEFGAADIDLDAARVEVSKSPYGPDSYQLVRLGQVDEAMRRRMSHVVGMCNYSLCLRNCEHVANYVFRFRWTSSQMDAGNKIMDFFKSYIAPEILHRVNSFPAQVRPHFYNPDRIKQPVYSFISDSFEASRFEYYLDANWQDDLNILIIGPTGTGKSRLINILFNEEICESQISFDNVTREIYFVKGKSPLTGRNVTVADTVGLCDRQWDDREVINMLRGRIGGNVRYLDAVFVICSAVERIPPNFFATMANVLDWLSYKKHKSRFMFLATKSDSLSQEKKDELKLQYKRMFEMERAQADPLDSSTRALKRIDAVGDLQFVGFPDESVFSGNLQMTQKISENWQMIKTFLDSPNLGDRISVPPLDSGVFCQIL